MRIDDYLRTRPEISDDMPTTTSGYFMTLDVPMPAFGAVARITQTILAPQLPEGGARLVLDIDASREGEWMCGAAGPSDGELDHVFSKLRDAKNLVFEASIADKARKLFQ